MPKTDSSGQKGPQGAASALMMVLQLNLSFKRLNEFEELKRYIRSMNEIYLDKEKTFGQQPRQVLEVIKKVQEERPQYFDKHISDIDARLYLLKKYILQVHCDARRDRPERRNGRGRDITSAGSSKTTQPSADKENVNLPKKHAPTIIEMFKHVSSKPTKAAKLASIANTNTTQSGASGSIIEIPSSPISFESPVTSLDTWRIGASASSAVWDVTTDADILCENDIEDNPPIESTEANRKATSEVPLAVCLPKTPDDCLMAALGLDNTSECKKEYEIIKRHLRNFSNTRLETFKPATSQPKLIRAAMEDLQMEWPDIFNMHVPAAEERLDLARAYLYKYHSRRAAKLRSRPTEASAPKLEPPTRKTKFRPSFSKESGSQALNLVEPTRDVIVSVPDCERTQHAISTPPSHLPHQPSPSIVSPSRTSSTPSSQRTQVIDENVLSFLSSCQPPLTHLANVFTDIGCHTAQHLFALARISGTDEQSRYTLLKRVFGGRRVTEMEIMIVERQLSLV